MNARRSRPSSRQRSRTRRQRCLGTRAFRFTRRSELVSRADAELLRGATADPPWLSLARAFLRGYPPILRYPKFVPDPVGWPFGRVPVDGSL